MLKAEAIDDYQRLMNFFWCTTYAQEWAEEYYKEASCKR